MRPHILFYFRSFYWLRTLMKLQTPEDLGRVFMDLSMALGFVW